MAERGLTARPKNELAGVIGESAGNVLPILAGAYAPQIGNALLRAGENMAAPATMNPQAGAIVYHGSPHKFDAFDSTKIGTGEGAQSYGHGLYLAESPAVAKSYKDILSTGKNARFDGKGYKVVADDSFRGFDVHSDNIASDFRGGVPVSEKLQGGFNSLADALSYVRSHAGAEELRYFDGDRFPLKGPLMPDDLLSGDVLRATPAGNLYKVDLPDEHIAKMLDWDKPLSQQAPEVQRAIKIYKGDNWWIVNKDRVTGEKLISEIHGRNNAELSSALGDMGVPGIRYLDGGSRGAGQGTSNYVVFPGNENLLQILERNGKPVR
jgi:hypothetical protein